MPRCVTGTPGLPGAEGGSRDPRPDSLPHAVPTALGSGGQAGPPLPAGASARSRERREAGARRDGALTGEAAPLHRQRGAACPPLPLPFSALRYPLAWGRGGPSTAAARDQPSRAAGPAGGSCWRERARDHPGRQHTAPARLLAVGPGGVCPSQQCILGAVVPVPGLAAGGQRRTGARNGRGKDPFPRAFALGAAAGAARNTTRSRRDRHRQEDHPQRAAIRSTPVRRIHSTQAASSKQFYSKEKIKFWNKASCF